MARSTPLRIHRYVALAASLAVVLACGIAAAGARVEPEQQVAWEEWTTLRLKARSVPFLSGRVILARSDGGSRILLETETVARFLGATLARSRTRTVIDPASGRTEEYTSFSPKRGRYYRFDEDGYVVEKLRPTAGFDAPRERWQVYSRLEYRYPADGPRPTFDYYGMLLHLRELELENVGDEAVLSVASSSGPRRFRVRVDGQRTRRRSFRNLDTGRKLRAETRELRLVISATDPEAGQEGFLRMKGDTEIWVESASKAPLEISGVVPRIPGRVVLELSGLGHAP